MSVCESVGIDSAGACVVFDGVRRNVRCVFISVSTHWVHRREGGRGDWVRSAAVRGDLCVGAVFSVRCTGTEVTHQLTDPRIKNGLDLVSQVLPSDMLLKIIEQTLQLCLTE